MKKLKLEELAVESFQTVEGARGAGSVRAHEYPTEFHAGNTCLPECPGTDWETCQNTCEGPTCWPGGCP
jgi:hypothetical protein